MEGGQFRVCHQGPSPTFEIVAPADCGGLDACDCVPANDGAGVEGEEVVVGDEVEEAVEGVEAAKGFGEVGDSFVREGVTLRTSGEVVVLGDAAGCLPHDGAECAGVELLVERNDKGLLFAFGPDSAELDVAAAAGEAAEAETVEQMAMTSRPESCLSLRGMGRRLQLECDNECGVRGQAEFFGVLALEEEAYGLLKVGDGLVEGLSLGDDGNVHAFGDVVRIAFVNVGFDRMLHNGVLAALC